GEKMSLFTFSPTGLTDGSDVTQTPLLLGDEGQSATMNCSQNKGSTYREMYWYRQLPGEGIKQIVFTTAYSAHEYEKGFNQDRFPAQKKLSLNDSAMYFCAARYHSATNHCSSVQIPPHHIFSSAQCAIHLCPFLSLDGSISSFRILY
uniref:Ig-like domain-containing protein n=1 Tax=Seriola lalandi dorsalis TaxID=1841481 RepID=A0A3B4X7B0_SERLL